jgi:hypothetical protein
VPAAAIKSPVSTTGRAVRSAGPNQRIARVSAPSTAKRYTGTARVDSRSQVVNGSWERWMEPTAPRSATIQNPSA